MVRIAKRTTRDIHRRRPSNSHLPFSSFCFSFGLVDFWHGVGPDTFGFAAPIPQIANLGGVKFSATHKVFWNGTNSFHYSFDWMGIDGTRPLAFGHGKDYHYNFTFSIEQIIEQWPNWMDRAYRMLFAFGYGEGGGGPTDEMFLSAPGKICNICNTIIHL